MYSSRDHPIRRDRQYVADGLELSFDCGGVSDKAVEGDGDRDCRKERQHGVEAATRGCHADLIRDRLANHPSQDGLPAARGDLAGATSMPALRLVLGREVSELIRSQDIIALHLLLIRFLICRW